jgi:hypothetical protein
MSVRDVLLVNAIAVVMFGGYLARMIWRNWQNTWLTPTQAFKVCVALFGALAFYVVALIAASFNVS